MIILAIDIGGTNIKILATGQTEPRSFPSGPLLTPAQMVAGIKEHTPDWPYDVVSIGYPGIVKGNVILSELHNLAPGWMNFDFEAAFGRPIRKMNDAAMQALGSYKKGITDSPVFEYKPNTWGPAEVDQQLLPAGGWNNPD